MRNYLLFLLNVVISTGVLCSFVWAAEASGQKKPARMVKAAMHPDCAIVRAGQPVWVNFVLTNLTSESLSLIVPETASLIHDSASGQEARQKNMEMGLPLDHVFSGKGSSAVTIKNSNGEQVDGHVSRKHKNPVPEVILAAHGSAGLRIELTQYYKSLTRPGKYQLIWRPYQGILQSAPLTIEVMAERQAVMLTDHGKMLIRFYYDQAPNHVHNFIELVKERFYDQLTFHRVVPGGIIQGGCPRGDGYGIRKDKKRLKAEFSDIEFVEGTLGMARTPSDPNSASCQFFINLGRQPSFDRKQTAFGYLVGDESFETIRKIAAVTTDSGNRPVKPVYIRTISLENILPRERTDSDGRSAGSSPKKTPEKKDAGARLGPARRLSRKPRVSDLATADKTITATKPARIKSK
ncbi:MAG: peptidylprolyl isomerase [Planctomycetota bacterium]|jgi:peptidyl-prolyl cis-trans isomerase B (cyclophilin B)